MNNQAGKRLLSLFLALALLLTLAPAALADEPGGGGEIPDGEDPPAAVTYTLSGVTVSPPSVTMKVGETRDLSATFTLSGSDGKTYTYAPGDPLPDGCSVNVTWEVSNGRGDEVRVTPTGSDYRTATMEALKVADTTQTEPLNVLVTVTPTAGIAGDAKTSTCTITINAADPTGLTVSPKTLELSPLPNAGNHQGQLLASVSPATASQAVTWTSSNPSVATVAPDGESRAIVTGAAPGTTTISAKSSVVTMQASCSVTVQGVVLEKESLEIRAGDRQNLAYTLYGSELQTSGVNWTTSDPAVVRVDSGYVYGVGEGTATVTVRVNGYSDYYDTISITVKKSTAAVITASAGTGSPLSFASLSYQFQDRCSSVLGQSLSFLSGLSVPTNQGTLYYRYADQSDTGAGVGTGERFYLYPGSGQMSLNEITFVPKADFSGTAEISYTGYASGTSFFQGTIQVSVAAQQDVSYSSDNGAVVQMDANDFAVVCRRRTGRELSYVTFSLPESSAGKLYYNYLSEQSPGTEVKASTQYKYSGSPSLGNVYFVPAAGYNGRVVISYTGWDTNRESYQGVLVIQVNAASDSGSVSYSVSQGGRVTLDDSDFNSLCRDLTGSTLDYIRFTLPSSSQGTLYYSYTSSSSERVSASKNYYRSSYPYLDQVSFLASDSFTGTVSIPFTGCAVSGAAFSGTLSIRVGAQADAIAYRVSAGESVDFQAGDFNDVSLSATGSSLRYVRFTLPASSRGTLYYNYRNGNYESKVSASKNYYRSSSPYLDQVTFVPAASFSGTVSIPFTGWSTSGKEFSGTVEITVGAATVSSISYSTSYNPVTFRVSDFRDACSDKGLGTLKTVQFTGLPSASAGRLYSSYNGFRSANSEARTSTAYSVSGTPELSQVTFVPRVGYSGVVVLSYTGTDTKGKTFQGQVRITVTPNAASSYFTDVGYSYSWAAASVDFLYENGVVNGTGNGIYSPDRAISRGSFLAMVDRALDLPHSSQRSFSDVPANSYYADAIQSAYALGIVDGYGDGTFRPDAPVTRAAAMTMLYRAMSSMGWSVGTENPAFLSSYPDAASVPDYAKGPLSAMVQAGVINGTSAGTLAPNRTMTRAEMAVVLARALTL